MPHALPMVATHFSLLLNKLLRKLPCHLLYHASTIAVSPPSFIFSSARIPSASSG